MLSGRLAFVRRQLPKLMRPSVILFLFNFGVSKLLIYATPLVIAVLVAADVYGAIELSQSVGMLFASFLIGPALQGLTQRFLIHKEPAYQWVTLVLVGGFLLFSLAALGLTILLGVGDDLRLVAASLGVAGLHVAGNSTVLMLGRRNAATWIAGTNILAAGLLVGLALAALGHVSVAGLTLAYAAIDLAALIAVGVLFRLVAPGSWDLLKRVTMIGLPMMLVATLSIWLGVGGRITVGAFNADALPVYGVAFRVGGLLLGFHQLVVTAFYVTLYRGRIRQADRMMTGLLTMVAVAGLAMCFAAFPIGALFADGALAGDGLAAFARILPLTVLQTFYWIGIALLQLRINRYNLAGPAIAPTAIVTIGGLVVIAAGALLVDRGVEALCWMLAAHSAALYVATSWVLRRRRLPHARIDAVTLIGTAPLVATALLFAAR